VDRVSSMWLRIARSVVFLERMIAHINILLINYLWFRWCWWRSIDYMDSLLLLMMREMQILVTEYSYYIVSVGLIRDFFPPWILIVIICCEILLISYEYWRTTHGFLVNDNPDKDFCLLLFFPIAFDHDSFEFFSHWFSYLLTWILTELKLFLMGFILIVTW